MKNFLANLFGSYASFVWLLLEDDLISYFAYFTTILIEIAFLWAFGVPSAFFFTVLLIFCIMNVFVASFWKARVGGSSGEIIQGIAFVAVIVILFLIGCKEDIVTSLLLFGLPLIVTKLWIIIREFQNTAFVGYDPNGLTMKISKIFQNPLFLGFSYLITIGLPFILLVVFTAMTPLALHLKIILPIIYILISPFIACIEDDIATCSIFELMGHEEYLFEKEIEETMLEMDKELRAKYSNLNGNSNNEE